MKTRIAIVLALLLLAGTTLVIQNPTLNDTFASLSSKLNLAYLLQPLSINKITEDDSCKTGYTWYDGRGCVKNRSTNKTPPHTTPAKTSRKKPKAPASNCAHFPPDDCASIPGCKLSGNRCVTDNQVAPISEDLPPPPAPSTSSGASCEGGVKGVKIKNGQYAYSGGKDEAGHYLCYQCQNGSWSTTTEPCKTLHSSGATVVSPPAGTAANEEGGARRKNCSDKENGEYMTVGDGSTRADGQKCMNGSWVDPTQYQAADYVKTGTPVGGEVDTNNQTPTSALTAGGNAACSTSYTTASGTTYVTIPDGESALGGEATTTETGERTAVKICKNGEFVPCNTANRADTPAVTNCTTPTVQATYMTAGKPENATCVLSDGYQLPAGRAIASAESSQVCHNGTMLTIPVTTTDVGNFLLGTTNGLSSNTLNNMQILCAQYEQTNCQGTA